MERSRFIPIRRGRRLPSRKTVRYLEGSFEDHERYVICWNCGFRVDVQRDLGPPERTGNYVTDYVYENVSIVGTGDLTVNSLTLDVPGNDMTILKADANGDPVTEYYTPRLALVSHGCPLCGVSNLT